jgi:lipopolysaccharide export LptBFGC system permease protein LptF
MILQGVGIKKIQLLQPVAYINIVVIFLSYLNVMFITPNANKRFDNMRDRMKNDIINLMFKNKNFNSVKNITFYANANERNALRDLMLYIKSMDGDDKDKIIYAKNAKINGVYAKMYHGNIQEFDMFDKTKNNIVFFEEYSLNLADYYDLDIKKGERVDEDCLNIKELLKMRKQENIKPIIIKRFVSPLISLFLSTLACVLVLNKPFSRMESEKEVVKIYFICIVCFSIFLYLVAKLEKAIVSYNLLLLYIASFFVADVVLIGKKNV